MGPKAPVAIIGAGPAGATLGRILHLASIPYTIFEGEASSDTRGQGSTLDLHDDTGLAAIKKCKLWDEFRKHARYDGEAMKFTDKHYKIYLEAGPGHEGESNGRPEIDRNALRQLLIDSLPGDSVKWGHRVRKIDEDGTLHFDHGTAGPFDLVVGADGAWSKVRPLVTDAKPFYSGIGGIGVTIDHPECDHPDLYKQVNRGSAFSFHDGKGLQPQQLGMGSIHAYTWSKRPENWMETCGFDPHKDVAGARKHLAELYHDWHPQLQKYSQVGNDELQPRNLYMLPVGMRWEHKKGFTLIGDSAHLMTPFAGEGVNLAMKDAVMLAQAIVDGVRNHNVDEEVKNFEEEMFPRGQGFQEMTKRNMDMLFSEDDGHLKALLTGMMDDVPKEFAMQMKEQLENPRQGP